MAFYWWVLSAMTGAALFAGSYFSITFMPVTAAALFAAHLFYNHMCPTHDALLTSPEVQQVQNVADWWKRNYVQGYRHDHY